MKRPARHNYRDRRHVSGCADVTERAVQMTGANGALDDRHVIRQRYTPNKLNVLRFGGFYGADAPSSRETIEMARRRMLPRIGAGLNYFSSIYVPDAGRATAASIGLPAGIYNVCADEPVVLSEYADAVIAAAGAPKPVRLPAFFGSLLFDEIWKYFPRSLRVSNAKLKAPSGRQPEVRSVREGWWRRNPRKMNLFASCDNPMQCVGCRANINYLLST